MPRPIRRLALAVATTAPLLLAGCSLVPAPSLSSEATASEQASAAPTSPPSGSPVELTFAAGAELDPTVQAQWADPLIADQDFVLTAPDDGNGSWEYTRVSTQCTAHFWQGTIGDIDTAQPDQAVSNAMLATWYRTTVEEIARYAEEDVVGYQLAGSGTVAVRIVVGSTESGGSYVTAARGLGRIPAGLVVEISCPSGQDARAEFAELQQDLVIIVGSPSG